MRYSDQLALGKRDTEIVGQWTNMVTQKASDAGDGVRRGAHLAFNCIACHSFVHSA